MKSISMSSQYVCHKKNNYIFFFILSSELLRVLYLIDYMLYKLMKGLSKVLVLSTKLKLIMHEISINYLGFDKV